MYTQDTSKENPKVEEEKSVWNTPELEVFSIKDKTEAGSSGITDSGIFS